MDGFVLDDHELFDQKPENKANWVIKQSLNF
jgi:hypothetical protein